MSDKSIFEVLISEIQAVVGQQIGITRNSGFEFAEFGKFMFTTDGDKFIIIDSTNQHQKKAAIAIICNPVLRRNLRKMSVDLNDPGQAALSRLFDEFRGDNDCFCYLADE